MSTGSAIERIIMEHEAGERKKFEAVYVASSWRNTFQPAAVAALRSAGIAAYDFKDEEGFHWSEVDPYYDNASQRVKLQYSTEGSEFEHYQRGLDHPRAEQGFNRDFTAMLEAEACLLVLPSGRSAHLEAGWFIGQGRPTAIWIPEFDGVWELMYKLADMVTDSLMDVLAWAGVSDQ